jgi:hypothetical protein
MTEGVIDVRLATNGRGRWSALLMAGGTALPIVRDIPKQAAERVAANFRRRFRETSAGKRLDILHAVMDAVP